MIESARPQVDIEAEEYGCRNLVWHLCQADRDVDVLALVANASWFAQHLAYDPSRRSYADDVEAALAAAQRLEVTGLTAFVVYNLTYALLGSLSNNIDPEALALMVAVGDGLQAQAHASLFADSIKKAEAYVRLAAAYWISGDAETGLRLLNNARIIAQGLPQGNERDRALASVGVGLAVAGQHQEGLALLNSVNDIELRERGLADVAFELFNRGDPAAGLRLAEHLSLPQHAIDALSHISHEARLHGADEFATLARTALEAQLARLKPEEVVVEALAGVVYALFLVGEEQAAWRIAIKHLDASWQGRAIRWVVLSGETQLANALYHHLSPEAQTQIDPADVALLHMANGDVERAIESAASIPQLRTRAGALGALVPQLVQRGDIQRATALLQQVGQPAVRVWSWAMIGQGLIRVGDLEGARTALRSALQETGTLRVRSLEQTYSEIAHALADAGEAETAIRLEHVLAVDPDDFYVAAAEAKLRDGTFLAADELIDRIQDEKRRSTLKARLLEGLCRSGAAVEARELLVSLHPSERAQAIIYTVRSYAEAEAWSAAAALAEQSERGDLRDEAFRQLTLAQLRHHEIEAAIQTTAMIMSNQIQAQARGEIAAALAKTGAIQRAVEIGSQIAPLDIRAAVLSKMAALAYTTGASELVALCMTACQGTRHLRAAVTNVAARMYADGREADARTLLTSLPLEQQNPAVIGVIRQIAGDAEALPKAIVQLAEAYGLNPWQSVISVWLSQGRFKEALGLMPKLEEPHARHAAMSTIVIGLAQSGAVSTALELMFAHMPPAAHPALLTQISADLLAKGEFDAALALINRTRSRRFRKTGWSQVVQELLKQRADAPDDLLRFTHRAFGIARGKGHEDVLDCLVAFSPVLVRLLSIEALRDLQEQLSRILKMLTGESFFTPASAGTLEGDLP